MLLRPGASPKVHLLKAYLELIDRTLGVWEHVFEGETGASAYPVSSPAPLLPGCQEVSSFPLSISTMIEWDITAPKQ